MGEGRQLTGHTVDGFEGPQDTHGADGRQVDVLQVQRVLHHPVENRVEREGCCRRKRQSRGPPRRGLWPPTLPQVCPRLPGRGKWGKEVRIGLCPSPLRGLGLSLPLSGSCDANLLACPEDQKVLPGAEGMKEQGPWVPTVCQHGARWPLPPPPEQPLEKGGSVPFLRGRTEERRPLG